MLKPLLLLLLHAIEQRTLVSTQMHHNDCLWELEPNVISQKRKEEPASPAWSVDRLRSSLASGAGRGERNPLFTIMMHSTARHRTTYSVPLIHVCMYMYMAMDSYQVD